MFSEAIVGVKMTVLVVFLLAVLGCSLAEGGLVSKCELKDQLTKAINELLEKAEKHKGMNVDNLVAKIVCHAEEASDFNTSVVYQLTPGEMGDHHGRGKRDTGYAGFFGLAEFEDSSITTQPPTQGRRHVRRAPSNTRPTPSTRPTPRTHPPHQDEEVWTLYGLFQLSSHLVCSDGTTPSPNICGMDCNNLLDDDPRDDISCLMAIFNHLIENGFGGAHKKEIRRMIRLIFEEDCSDEEADEYFAECS